MSWSDQYTGIVAYGITESYHRILIKINFQQLPSRNSSTTALPNNPANPFIQKFQNLSKHLFYHFLIIITSDDLNHYQSSQYEEIVQRIQYFLQCRYVEEEETIHGEVSPSKEYQSKQLKIQRYMLSIQLPLHETLRFPICSLLTRLLQKNAFAPKGEDISLTYIIFQLKHNNQKIYQSSATLITERKDDLPPRQNHHVFELIPQMTSAVKDYDRIDDYNNIKEIIHLLATIQHSVLAPLQSNSSMNAKIQKVYWGINADNIPQEHDYLDYFFLLYQELTQTQAANDNFKHNKPEHIHKPMVYNQTDQNLDHGKDPFIYGSRKTPVAVELHAVYLTLSSTNVANFRTETIDLVHSFGFNAMVEVPYDEKEYYFAPYRSEVEEDAAVLLTELDETQLERINAKKTIESNASQGVISVRSLASKYNPLSVETFICKCLLQLGGNLVFSFQFPLQEFFVKHISRLCHPFNYRKLYVSAVRVITISIDIDDLEAFREISEENEIKDYNSKRTNLYLQAPVPKQLHVQVSY